MGRWQISGCTCTSRALSRLGTGDNRLIAQWCVRSASAIRYVAGLGCEARWQLRAVQVHFVVCTAKALSPPSSLAFAWEDHALFASYRVVNLRVVLWVQEL